MRPSKCATPQRGVRGAKEEGCRACVPEDVGRGEGDFQEKDGGDRRGGRRRRRGIPAAYPYPRIANVY